MTLRLRLLLLLIGLVAVGLVVCDLVTYDALRTFLVQRVDQQLEVAAFPVGRALFAEAGLGQALPTVPRTGRFPATTPGSGVTRGVFVHGGGFFTGSTARARDVLVPPGTYGQLRRRDGVVVAHLFFTYGVRAPAPPDLPHVLPGAGSAASADLDFTTAGPAPASVPYRALAKPLGRDGGVVVVAVPLTDLDSTLHQLRLIELVVSIAVLIGLGGLSWVMVRRDLRPLDEFADTALAIAGGDRGRRVRHGSDATEVGRLGLAFNTMVDGLQDALAQRAASEERLRRFLADASHELRTPLTSIRGYAELFDLGVRDRPDDLATSLRTIRSEADRMATLVDDLLLLAQLDHERPLRTDPVDLGALATEAARAATAGDPDHPVVVTSATPGSVTVSGDADRLRQVVDNLLVNAQTHSPTGAEVEVSVAGAADGEGAVLEVRDHGPGVDPVESERIFEPFYRSDPSRARRSGGAGLGLAIVRAVVTAHGGTVEVVPGTAGASFVVRLPRGSPQAV